MKLCRTQVHHNVVYVQLSLIKMTQRQNTYSEVVFIFATLGDRTYGNYVVKILFFYTAAYWFLRRRNVLFAVQLSERLSQLLKTFRKVLKWLLISTTYLSQIAFSYQTIAVNNIVLVKLVNWSLKTAPPKHSKQYLINNCTHNMVFFYLLCHFNV